MTVRQSPGVYVKEIDKSLGMSLIGTGGIGIASKLNKGVVGKPFAITSEQNLINMGGMPLPGFNLVSWHTISNILLYGGAVIVSRAENTEFSAKHDAVKQKFEIPVNTAQVALFQTGKATNFDFDKELNDMIKNRTKFKTANEQNAFDLIYEDEGVVLQDVDNALLVANDDELEEMVEENAFNTKAKKLFYLPKLGLKSAIKDDSIPSIEPGQVYNHHGKVIEIGNDIYDDHWVLEVHSDNSNEGTGLLEGTATENKITGNGTSFLTELKPGSDIEVSWFGVVTSGSGNGTLTQDSENFKKMNSSNDLTSILAPGDRIIVDSIFRIVDSVTTNAVFLTADAPVEWGTDPIIDTDWSYQELKNDNYVVESVLSNDEILIEETISDTFEDATFTFKFNQSNSEFDGVQTVVEKFYRYEDDESYKTLKGVNVNVHKLLRVGSKIVFNLDGNEFARFVEEIPMTGNDTIIIDEPLEELTTDSNDAKVFKYANFYFEADSTTVGTKVYTPTGVGVIVATDETDNLPISTLFRYVVKPISGVIRKRDKMCLAKLNDDEWSYWGDYVNRYYPLVKENNMYMMAYETLGTGDLALEKDDIIFFGEKLDDETYKYKAFGKIHMAVRQDDEERPKDFVIELLSNDDTGVNPEVVVDDYITKGVYLKAGLNMTGLPVNDEEFQLCGNTYIFKDSPDPNNPLHIQIGNGGTTIENTNDTRDNTLAKFNTISGVIAEKDGDIIWVNIQPGKINEYKATPLTQSVTDSEWIDDNNDPIAPSGELLETASTETWDDLVHGKIDFIHQYEDVILYEIVDHSGEMLMVNETVSGLTDAFKRRYTYTYNYTGDAEVDKQEHTVYHTATNKPLAGIEFMRIFASSPGAWTTSERLSVAVCDMSSFKNNARVESGGITFRSLFDYTPDLNDNTLFCVVVVKDDIVVERYIVSTNPNSKDAQGSSQYVYDVINQRSSYIRVLLNTSIFAPFEPNGYDIYFDPIYNTNLNGGYSGKLFELFRSQYYNNVSTVYMDITSGYVKDADVMKAYEVFANVDDIDISYLVDGEWCGKPIIQNKMIDICVERGDAIAIISPHPSSIVGIKNTATIVQNMINYVNDNSLIGGDRFFQFAGFFANCKMIYDDYNETYVWLPISADVVGLNAYIDEFFEVWYAVAGQARGNVRNIVKLGWNPTQLERDSLYSNRINPVVFFKGEGTQVYGVRSLCSLKSDLADIYSRKTLNFISKNLQVFLRQVLFEFNDPITRGQVVTNIDPFLRSIRTRRGLIDYKIICDESNNPMTVVENNELICDIYLKMPKIVEQVSLNFIITKASVSFEEAMI